MEEVTVGVLVSKSLSHWNFLSGNVLGDFASTLGDGVTTSDFIISTGFGSNLGSDGVVGVVDY